MVEINFLLISWMLGIFGILMCIFGSFVFVKGIINMKISSKTFQALVFMGITAVLVVVDFLVVFFCWLKKIETTNNIWMLFSVTYIILVITWIFGIYSLLRVITGEDVEEVDER